LCLRFVLFNRAPISQAEDKVQLIPYQL
jgi:hypothetical protein